MTGSRRLVAVLAVLTAASASLVLAAPAAAQAAGDEVEARVDIDFEVGDFDSDRDDWRVVAVSVAGDLDDGQPLTVEIRGDGDAVLWSGSGRVTEPVTRFDVTTAVYVGDVAAAGVSQPVTQVGGVVIDRSDVDVFREGGGGSGGGRIALSMILAVLVLALLFRSPLPSATSQRWTK